jgi:hypothetical protein
MRANLLLGGRDYNLRPVAKLEPAHVGALAGELPDALSRRVRVATEIEPPQGVAVEGLTGRNVRGRARSSAPNGNLSAPVRFGLNEAF